MSKISSMRLSTVPRLEKILSHRLIQQCYGKRVRRIIWEYKARRPCSDCGNKYPPEAMDFDHVRGPKAFNIGNARSVALKALAVEIAKCDLVCATCHRLRTCERRDRRPPSPFSLV